MPSRIEIRSKDTVKRKAKPRPEFNANTNSTYKKRTEEEYKAELAKMKA